MSDDDLIARLDDRWLDASRSAFDCATCGLAANDLAEAAAALRELEAERDALRALLPGVYYMDPPDGGDVDLVEQLRRMEKDAARYRWLRNNAVREKPLGDKYIEFHCDFETWNDVDAAIDAALKETP